MAAELGDLILRARNIESEITDTDLTSVQKRAVYAEVVDLLVKRIAKVDPNTVGNLDPREAVSIGHVICMQAGVLCSLAQNGDFEDAEKTQVLDKAQGLLEGDLFLNCLPILTKHNVTASGKPIFWLGETKRLLAQIEETKPKNEDKFPWDIKASAAYGEAIQVSIDELEKLSTSPKVNYELEVAIKAVLYASLIDRARLFPTDRRDTEGLVDRVLVDIGVAVQGLLEVYEETKELDWTEAFLWNALIYCDLARRGPYNSALVFSELNYLKLVGIAEDKTRFWKRLEVAREQGIKNNFYDRLEKIINE